MVCVKKLPCMVRFALDHLRKTEVKQLLNDFERILNGPGMDAEPVHDPFCFMYVCTTRMLQLDVTCIQHHRYLSWISNSASRLPMCNGEVEHNPVFKS